MFGVTWRFFWQTLIAAFITMVFIYIIKRTTQKVHVPLVSDIAAGV